MDHSKEHVQAAKFHHVHVYVDKIQPLETYKIMERCLNQFAEQNPNLKDIKAQREEFLKLKPTEWNENPEDFKPQDRDFVMQLIIAFGFRIIQESKTNGSYSLALSTQDTNGAKFIVSCKDNNDNETGKYPHFDAKNIDRFYNHQSGRQGFANLAFEVPKGELSFIKSRYETLHPKLIKGHYDCEDQIIFEVFAFYCDQNGEKVVDQGTILRFIEPKNSKCLLAGMNPVSEVEFPKFDKLPAYSDHWVSNVVDRVCYLNTLHETFGWNPKVDFNAGVVAAGEAQIESTVCGNNSDFSTTDIKLALQDQTQIYLPINNALSEVGHVHLYLKEIGQGIQHIANRVDDIVVSISRANAMREITGSGFTFLNIPRSYYGRLTQMKLESVCKDQAAEIFNTLVKNNVCDSAGIVKQEIQDDEIMNALREFKIDNIQAIIKEVKLSRYSNLYSLLKDLFTEETYLEIMRNKILVDIQGQDVLFQIFTSNVLQRQTGQEAPFLEFIQRVCSATTTDEKGEKKLRAGCGGFGIRNFLTLFLSIEVSKAMNDLKKAIEDNNQAQIKISQKMVNTLTEQMEEANPILTDISDAMTAEADYLELLGKATDEQQKQKLSEQVEIQRKKKNDGSELLKVTSARYNQLMKDIRQGKA